MKRIALTLSLILATPAFAEEPTPLPGIEGLERFSEGMREMFESFADDLAPLMQQLGDQIKDLNAYHPPEVLPNGDIIIRRKPTPEAPEATPKIGDGGDVEL